MLWLLAGGAEGAAGAPGAPGASAPRVRYPPWVRVRNRPLVRDVVVAVAAAPRSAPVFVPFLPANT